MPRANGFDRRLMSESYFGLVVILTSRLASPADVACPCVEGCRCNVFDDAVGIACSHSLPSELLLLEIDKMLSSLSIDHIRKLSIVNTSLTSVPPAVCRLSGLRSLRLSSNRLTRLTDNCLNGLTYLEELTLDNNNITELQDGVFAGLNRLHSLELANNKIHSIGLNVFSNVSDLLSLDKISLAYNELTSLEPWPLLRGVNSKKHITVFVPSNKISRFTNHIGWQYRCERLDVRLNLDWNNITHVTDLTTGWNVHSLTLQMCLYNHGQEPFSLHGNPFVCDCVDYPVLGFLYMFQHAGALDECYCAEPSQLYGIQLKRVPLMELVCDVTRSCPPGCRCVDRPANKTMHVDCSSGMEIDAVPLKLPALPKKSYVYKLLMGNNKKLRHVEARGYFTNVLELDAGDSSIQTIDEDAWKWLMNVSFVSFRGNQLERLPETFSEIPISNKTLLDLGDNPWDCSCENRWMKNWLGKIQHNLQNKETINCVTPQRLHPRNILNVSDDEFCMDPAVRMAIIVSAVVTFSLFLIFLTGSMLYRYRYRLYAKWNFHPFDRDECVGEEMDYDVFLSCSSLDDAEAVVVLELLERYGYRCCFHGRDFVAGETVMENICRAIERSKRCVCILTRNFIDSSYCLKEFNIAQHLGVLRRRNRIIFLSIDDNPLQMISDSSDVSALGSHLRQYTYIVYGAPNWLQSLMYALPVTKIADERRGDLPVVLDCASEAPSTPSTPDDDYPLIVPCGVE